MMLVTSASSSFNSLADILAAAKAKPGSITYATAGTGSTSHVLTEMLAQQAGVQLLHVPYKGGAPASAAAANGEVNMGLLNLGSTPEEAAARIKREFPRYAAAIKAANIRAD